RTRPSGPAPTAPTGRPPPGPTPPGCTTATPPPAPRGPTGRASSATREQGVGFPRGRGLPRPRDGDEGRAGERAPVKEARQRDGHQKREARGGGVPGGGRARRDLMLVAA